MIKHTDENKHEQRSGTCNGCHFCLIPDAVMKYKAGLGEKEIESLMAETLKHAPAHINKSAEV